ncbi:MAG: polyprenyl synthetase family protein, partial [Vicinamibacteria bacterium]
HAFQVLATASSNNGPPDTSEGARRLRAIALLAEAAGMNGMIGGQVIDLESEGKRVDERTLDRIHQKKTGALMEAAARLGAVMGDGDEDQIETLGRFGREVGLAFQIVDDLLDVEGDAATLGKSAGKDQRAGKATYPSVHGIENTRSRAKELAQRAVDLVTPFGPAGEPLVCLARRIVDRNS